MSWCLPLDGPETLGASETEGERMFQLLGAEWLVVLFLGGLIVSLLIAPYFVAKSAREKGRSFGAWLAAIQSFGKASQARLNGV